MSYRHRRIGLRPCNPSTSGYNIFVLTAYNTGVMLCLVTETPWQVDDYRTPQGGRPVWDFLMKLSQDARAKATAALTMLGAKGNELRLPLSRQMGGGLFEIRVQHSEGPFRI